MRLLPLVVLLAVAGCSSTPAPTPSAQNPPEPVVGQFETSASIETEIKRRYPPETNQGNFAETANVVFDILDNSKTEATARATRDWAANNNAMLDGISKDFKIPSNARSQAITNCNKWIIAAANTKAGAGSTDYETAKKNALEEAARADSLPTP